MSHEAASAAAMAAAMAPQDPASNASNNATEVYVELIPLTYSGAVPAPVAACTDPTPDEQHRLAVARKQGALKQKEEARHQQLADGEEAASRRTAAAVESGESITEQLTASVSEVYANIKNAVSQAVVTIEMSANDVSNRTEAQVRQIEYQHSCEAFRKNFPSLAQAGEVLLADYGCSAMHGGTQVHGHVQITRHHLCFYAETSSAIAKATDAVMDAFAAARQAATAAAMGHNTESNNSANGAPQTRLVGIKQVIPLSEVACVLPSVALETVGGAHAPFFLPLPTENVRATALQVYSTMGNKLYQFLAFNSLISRASGALSDSVKGTALDRAFNYLDHAWRETAEVPLKDVEYV